MTVRILTGDVRDRLAELDDESVHCVVTSPPYFGLRDYGVAGQIGLEPTLAEYIDTMTAVFRDVRRVLRSDGVCWLNIGDSYCSHDPGGHRDGEFLNPGGRQSAASKGARNKAGTYAKGQGGLKAKDLMMVPARLALALQADGWWLRSDIIWHKPNPMPESVTDRPTNAHEHIFLLTKSARYWYDADAVREIGAGRTDLGNMNHPARLNQGGEWSHTEKEPNGANLRNVWPIATVGFPGAHFATFPPEIPRRCIKAGTSEKGACSACGAPWSRVVDKVNPRLSDEYDARPQTPKMSTPLAGRNDYGGKTGLAKPGWREFPPAESTTTGWQPGCTCDADVIPCTVMDIFFGSGTTGLVADQLGRDCIGIELNPEYARMAEDRIRNAAPLFAEVVA